MDRIQTIEAIDALDLAVIEAYWWIQGVKYLYEDFSKYFLNN